MEQKELIQSLTKYRKDNNIFKRSLEERSPKFTSITYDGPPFASGTPHFGHGITSSMKDAILRYKTMTGYRVNRDRGRDCHGLPVEKAVEKHLGIDGKRDIEEKLGVEKFTEECRNYVSNTSDERRTFVDNLGRRADMDNAYYTMDLSFMESVLWAFQTMYNKNLVYKGFKVQRYCPSCATTLANNEVNEGYKDRQDPAITIKFPLYNDDKEILNKYETTKDGFVQVTSCVIKKDNKFLMLYHNKGLGYYFTGGKLGKGHSLEDTVKREIKEEIGVETTSMKHLGNYKHIVKSGLREMKFVEVEISGEPQNMEPEKHAQLIRAEIIDSDNELGFAVRIEETIVDDAHEIIDQFYDLYIYHKSIVEKIEDGPVSVLAWTTTPWTLPSNMFAAIGKHIHYVMVFDPAAKEYFIIAENLIKQYYRDENEYVLIDILKGEDLIGIKYEPLFQYINQSKIEQKYKDQFFKIIAGEFVSTEDGTGIVHIAPSFGAEDFEAVAQFLPREESKKWLFLPINEYGEFTDEVPEWKGIRVYEANKEVIHKLKNEGKLIGQKSYNHSYPHCRRCDTPLISKAITSRFIKEPELQPITVPNSKNIGFVPEAIKNRFEDVLKTAPDWNLSRNRYRGSPLPIRENTNNEEDKIVIGTLEELFQNTKDGSANITKNIIIRHEETTYNPDHKHDSYGKADLTDKGSKGAKELVDTLNKISHEDSIVVISPLQRTLETITPFLEKFVGEKELSSLKSKYTEIQRTYQELRNNNELISYIKDTTTQKLFPLHDKVFVDFRHTDIITPEWQDTPCEIGTTTKQAMNIKLTPQGECMNDVEERIKSYVVDVNQKFKNKTIITITHKDSAVMMQKSFKDFDYLTQKSVYTPTNGQINILYRDNTRNAQVDLHKPYIDTYRFKKGDQEYRRIPEVMDCRFESGAMPFGQVGYTGEKNLESRIQNSKLIYPADFIIEGLDQTRGRFRTLHVVGNAVMGANSFNNVIINGMILAEDGKKMSKKLKNYPDPEYLFYKYGSDAYRLYMLSSPGVRAEPVKFSEKGVDQIYKDFTAAITNAYKFFETYAKVDNFSYNKPTIHFIRHAEADGQDLEAKLTQKGKDAMQTKEFIEKVLRINPDIIYTSPYTRTQETAQIIQTIFKDYLNKEVEIKVDESLENLEASSDGYTTVINNTNKKILIVSHLPMFQKIRSTYYIQEAQEIQRLEIVKLPSYKITNELDKWILAEVNTLGLELEVQMNKYVLDNGAKLVLGFIDKLNNRYIRRSRRRFWASGMDEDKTSAYHTMYEVLETYLKMAAPFAPFITEHIYLELQKFKHDPLNATREPQSIHLEHLPLSSNHYINKELLSEIETVRKIISLGLFIRSKNRIAVKQPLAKIELKIDN